MKKIKLTNKEFAIVDDEDFEYLNQFGWQLGGWGYATRTVYIKGSGRKNQKNKTIVMHNLIMKSPKGLLIDHINRNKLDNRKENLRIATNQQNKANRLMCKNNKTGYKGVFWDKNRNKYKATLTFNKKTINLGRFLTKEEAFEKYQEAAKHYFGEFASF